MQCELKSLSKVLIFAKKPTLSQTNNAFLFLTSALSTQLGIKKWKKSKEAKRLDSIQSYITKLEWFQVVNNNSNSIEGDTVE